MNTDVRCWVALWAAVLLPACESEVVVVEDAAQTAAGSPVTESRLLSAGSDTANWMTHGRTYDEQRFSPLDDVNADNVGELGLAWFFDITSV